MDRMTAIAIMTAAAGSLHAFPSLSREDKPITIDPPGEVAWRVYLLRCADGSLYCGITVDFDRRFHAHNAGKASKYTRSRLPVELALISIEMSSTSAARVEAAIKKLKSDQKLQALHSLADTEFPYEDYCRREVGGCEVTGPPAA
jgi:putative endonuclease